MVKNMTTNKEKEYILLLKGNMPQDCCFFHLTYEDGNIIFSTSDNTKKVLVKLNDYVWGEEYLPEASERTIIKTEDELFEKLLSTKHYEDAERLETITRKFNKYSWCFNEALGIGGAAIVNHYKQTINI